MGQCGVTRRSKATSRARTKYSKSTVGESELFRPFDFLFISHTLLNLVFCFQQTLGETEENGERLIWAKLSDSVLEIDACFPRECVEQFNE